MTQLEIIYYSDISAMRKALEKISIELEKANKIKVERLRVIGRSGDEEVELDSVKVGQKVYPISGSDKHKVAKVVEIMPDGKTVLVKFEHPVGNRYAKYIGNELSTYADGGEVEETNKL